MDEKQEVQRLRQRVQLLEALIDKQTTLLYQKPGHAVAIAMESAACNRSAASSTNKCAGATTVVTSTLHQALVMVEHDGLSAAVLDHLLPDGDSSPLCQRLDERMLPFVVYSGLGNLHGACAKGAHIKKPENAKVLVSMVAQLIADN